MELNSRNIIGYLLESQLISPDSLLSGCLYWKQSPARNNVFMVADRNGAGLFVKQLRSPDHDSIRLMQQDTNAQHILHHYSDFEPVKAHVPEFHGYDERHHLMVTELFEDAASVIELTEQREQLSASQAMAMARLLARLHTDLSLGLEKDPVLRFFDRKMPWILNFPNASDFAPEVVLQHIRQDEFLLHQLDEAAHHWKPTALIHGDIKLSNFIVRQSDGEDQLKLIDWEMANIGDPLWDLAGLLHTYVVAGLSFMTASSAHYQLPESKQFWNKKEVTRIWQIIWKEYVSHMSWTAKEMEKAAEKTVGFIAARLIQSAVELNRVRPEFLAPAAWALLEEARGYFKMPHEVMNRWNASTNSPYDS